MIHHWFGWISVFFCVLACGTWLARKLHCKNKRLLRWLRGKQHHIWGELMLATGVIHGVLALLLGGRGNMVWRVVSGVLSLTIVILLRTAAERHKGWKGKNWLQCHGMLTVLLMLLLLAHVVLF